MDHPEGIAYPTHCNRAARLTFQFGMGGSFSKGKNCEKNSLDALKEIFLGVLTFAIPVTLTPILPLDISNLIYKRTSITYLSVSRDRSS